MQEIWKDICGYEGIYQVSSFGNVKSVNRKKQILLKLNKNKEGYYRVGLSKNKKRKWFSVHKLVAMAFLENVENFPCINHKDENKLNNQVDNLEWCSYKYNNNYGMRKEKAAKSKQKSVSQYNKDGEFVKRYDSIISASQLTGISKCSICSCAKNKLKSAGGFLWEYAHK